MKTKPKAIMNPNHPDWPAFRYRLERMLKTNACKHDHTNARAALREQLCNVKASLQEMEDRGGFCDCEILFNVGYLVSGCTRHYDPNTPNWVRINGSTVSVGRLQ